MNYKIFIKAIKKEKNNFIRIKCDKENDIFINVTITLPKDISNINISNILFLTTFKVIEPFVRCGLSFEINSEYDFETLSNNLKENNNIDDEIFLYTNLDWMKNNISFKQNKEINLSVKNDSFFINENTISILNENLANNYHKEVSKSLPFAIYERLRAKCDFAWRCSECPKGLNGECDAILYEQYIQVQN